MPSPEPIKILSMDGGPGPTVHIRILHRLECELLPKGKSLLQGVDLFAGTSNGALLSLYLAWELTQVERGVSRKTTAQILADAVVFADECTTTMGLPGEQVGQALGVLAKLYELTMVVGKPRTERLPFLVRKLRELAHNAWGALGAPWVLWSVRGFLLGRRPLADGQKLRRLLERTFGDATLSDLKRHVVVVSFDTNTWAPRAFRNFGAKDKDGEHDVLRDGKQRLVEVAMCTSALPVMMPVHGGQSGHGYLDGIFGVNNPVMTATSLAIRHLVAKEEHKGSPFERLRILSLGLEQGWDERLLERRGGPLALLGLLAVDDRDARLSLASMPVRERLEYLLSAKRRHAIQRRLEHGSVKLGQQSFGWADFLERPTFLGNMAIHGMDDEAWRTCRRLFRSCAEEHRDPYAHRLRIRLNLARSLWGVLVEGATLAYNADRSFENEDDASLTVDERENAKRLTSLRSWLLQHWTEEASPANTAPIEAPALTRVASRRGALLRSAPWSGDPPSNGAAASATMGDPQRVPQTPPAPRIAPAPKIASARGTASARPKAAPKTSPPRGRRAPPSSGGSGRRSSRR